MFSLRSCLSLFCLDNLPIKMETNVSNSLSFLMLLQSAIKDSESFSINPSFFITFIYIVTCMAISQRYLGLLLALHSPLFCFQSIFTFFPELFLPEMRLGIFLFIIFWQSHGGVFSSSYIKFKSEVTEGTNSELHIVL